MGLCPEQPVSSRRGRETKLRVRENADLYPGGQASLLPAQRQQSFGTLIHLVTATGTHMNEDIRAVGLL